MIAKGIDFENWRSQRDLNTCYCLERTITHILQVGLLPVYFKKVDCIQ